MVHYIVQQQVALLHGAAVQQPLPARLADDAALLQREQPGRVVERVGGVGDRLPLELGSESDARQRVQRVEEVERAALDTWCIT